MLMHRRALILEIFKLSMGRPSSFNAAYAVMFTCLPEGSRCPVLKEKTAIVFTKQAASSEYLACGSDQASACGDCLRSRIVILQAFMLVSPQRAEEDHRLMRTLL